MRPGSRQQPQGRRKASRKPYRRILVLCEGKVTEPEYLRGLKQHLRNPTLEIEVVKAAGVPVTIVDAAVLKKKSSDKRRKRHPEDAYDEVWAVFDRDEHPHFAEACQKARDNEVGLAVSNPCFELWLLLHIRDQTAPLDRYQAQHTLLAACNASDDKHVDFAFYAPRLDCACDRACELDRRAQEGGTDGNPTTTVYKLVACIKSDSSAAEKGRN